MSELRYHPFLDQWVITATHRQDRTFLPPDDYCPLCPTQPGGFPTEIPVDKYDIAVFENKFPSLRSPAATPDVETSGPYLVRPSDGVCEVVCYTSRHDGSFAQLDLHQTRKLTRVWKHRYEDLGSREAIEYVFIFENKGKEIGVTLSHPHGQIYGYPFIPPTLAIELASEKRHFEATGKPLMASVLEEELKDGRRIVWQNDTFIAFVPFFARYPYEVYVAPKEHRPSLSALSPKELDDLAEGLLVVARAYDKLFGFSLPYMMVMHQEPTTPGHEYAWLHVEFYPPYRTATKLKYLAGSEAGAGAYVNDTLPEVTAATLRALIEPVKRPEEIS